MEVRGCHERLGSGVSEMKRLMVIAVVVVCLLAEAGLSPQLAHADGNIRCAQRDRYSGACTIEVRAPGSGGQPGKPGKSPARPRERTGTGNTGGESEEKPPGHIEAYSQTAWRPVKPLVRTHLRKAVNKPHRRLHPVRVAFWGMPDL